MDQKALLQEAANDITFLRRENELLNAKLEGVEMMAMAVRAELPTHTGIPMKECVVSKIKAFLAKKEE